MAQETVFHLRRPIKLMGFRWCGIELAVTPDALVIAFQDDPMRPFKVKIPRTLGSDQSGYGMALQADLIPY